MIPSLSQEELTQYASSAQTIQEPTGTDYSKGVSVGRTIPAKWWNWLFSNATKRIVQSRNDANNMLTELKNVVTDAGLTPSGSDNTQLTQAVEAKADKQIDDYVAYTKALVGYWNNLPQIMLPNSSSSRAVINKIANAPEDIYFTRKTSGTSKCVITKDFKNFLTTDIPIGETHALIYFGDTYVHVYVLFYKLHVLTSDDFINWTEVAVIDLTQSIGGNSTRYDVLCAFVIEDTLYVARSYTFGSESGTSSNRAYTDLIYTSDLETFSTSLNIASAPGCWNTYEVGDQFAFEPTHIDGSLYLISGFLTFDTSTLTFTSAVGAVPGAQTVRSPTFKLNGVGIFCTLRREYSSEGYHYNCVQFCKFIPDGGSTWQDISGYAMHYACSSACGDVIILQPEYSMSRFSFIFNLPVDYTFPKCTAFSYDGVNIVNFPTQFNTAEGLVNGVISAVFKIENYYYLSVCTGIANNGFVMYTLYRTSHLSNDYNDYEIVSAPSIQGRHGEMFTAGVGDIIISVYGEYSLDLGVTWHKSNSYTDSIGVGTHKGDIFFNDTWFRSPGSVNTWDIAEYATRLTQSRINRVIGHTLYLR